MLKNKEEYLASIKAGNDGGAYLESINKYDVRLLSRAEWDKFIEIVCESFYVPF